MTHPMFTEDELDVYEYLKPGMVIARDAGFGKIYVHLDSGQVTFVQRWQYFWELDEDKRNHLKASPWTDEEQCDFHYTANLPTQKCCRVLGNQPLTPWESYV